MDLFSLALIIQYFNNGSTLIKEYWRLHDAFQEPVYQAYVAVMVSPFVSMSAVKIKQSIGSNTASCGTLANT